MINTGNEIAKLQDESIVIERNALQIKNASIVFSNETSGTLITNSVKEFNMRKINRHASAVENHTPVISNNRFVITVYIFAINQNDFANANDRLAIKQNEFANAVDLFAKQKIDFATANQPFDISKNYSAGKHYEYANGLNVIAIKKDDFANDNDTYARGKNSFVSENWGNHVFILKRA